MALDTAWGKLGADERRALARELIHRLNNAIAPLDIRLQLPLGDAANNALIKDAHFAVGKVRELIAELQGIAGVTQPQ